MTRTCMAGRPLATCQLGLEASSLALPRLAAESLVALGATVPITADQGIHRRLDSGLAGDGDRIGRQMVQGRTHGRQTNKRSGDNRQRKREQAAMTANDKGTVGPDATAFGPHLPSVPAPAARWILRPLM